MMLCVPPASVNAEIQQNLWADLLEGLAPHPPFFFFSFFFLVAGSESLCVSSCGSLSVQVCVEVLPFNS